MYCKNGNLYTNSSVIIQYQVITKQQKSEAILYHVDLCIQTFLQLQLLKVCYLYLCPSFPVLPERLTEVVLHANGVDDVIRECDGHLPFLSEATRVN